jgi:hypothetical protein
MLHQAVRLLYSPDQNEKPVVWNACSKLCLTASSVAKIWLHVCETPQPRKIVPFTKVDYFQPSRIPPLFGTLTHIKPEQWKIATFVLRQQTAVTGH